MTRKIHKLILLMMMPLIVLGIFKVNIVFNRRRYCDRKNITYSSASVYNLDDMQNILTDSNYTENFDFENSEFTNNKKINNAQKNKSICDMMILFSNVPFDLRIITKEHILYLNKNSIDNFKLINRNNIYRFLNMLKNKSFL